MNSEDFTLNDLHLAYLRRIKKDRESFATVVLAGIGIVFLITFLLPVGNLISVLELEGNSWITRHIIQLLGFVALALICYGLIYFVYIQPIVPLNRDIKQRSGTIKSFQILRKHYFPMTGHAYFFFAEPDIPNITVEESTFHQYQEGDFVSVRRAKHSKIVFEDIDRQGVNRNIDSEDMEWLQEHYF